jgi:hypothetical protein
MNKKYSIKKKYFLFKWINFPFILKVSNKFVNNC